MEKTTVLQEIWKWIAVKVSEIKQISTEQKNEHAFKSYICVPHIVKYQSYDAGPFIPRPAPTVPVSNKCYPGNNDGSCCTASNPCGIGQGDCDNNFQCAGDLNCGANNCAAGNLDMDCCEGPNKCDPAFDDRSCCTSSHPCGYGQGDCDKDSHCEGDLVCGDDNCSAGQSNMDCCESKSLCLFKHLICKHKF